MLEAYPWSFRNISNSKTVYLLNYLNYYLLIIVYLYAIFQIYFSQLLLVLIEWLRYYFTIRIWNLCLYFAYNRFLIQNLNSHFLKLFLLYFHLHFNILVHHVTFDIIEVLYFCFCFTFYGLVLC